MLTFFDVFDYSVLRAVICLAVQPWILNSCKVAPQTDFKYSRDTFNITCFFASYSANLKIGTLHLVAVTSLRLC